MIYLNNFKYQQILQHQRLINFIFILGSLLIPHLCIIFFFINSLIDILIIESIFYHGTFDVKEAINISLN